MSQPVPPPNQQPPYDAQPGDGNPFAAQQPGQPGQPGVPTGNPFAGQQPASSAACRSRRPLHPRGTTSVWV